MVDATVLEGEEAGQVGDGVVGEAGREPEEAEQRDCQHSLQCGALHEIEEDREEEGTEVTDEVHDMGPEDGVPPAEPVVAETPDEAARNVASPEGCLYDCRDPVQVTDPVVLHQIITINPLTSPPHLAHYIDKQLGVVVSDQTLVDSLVVWDRKYQDLKEESQETPSPHTRPGCSSWRLP